MIKSLNKILFEAILLVTFVLTAFIYVSRTINSLNKTQVLGLKTISKGVKVTAWVGEYRFSLFGYTSPGALVSLEGMSIFDQTYAGDDGFFMFENRFSPFSPKEVCLTAIDQFGRVSTPTCLPPFPTKYNVTIGPIILPPTISLNIPNESAYYVGDEAILTGQTIPNSTIHLLVFTDTTQSPLISKIYNLKSKISLIKQAEAFSLPQLQAVSDNKGNFSISLPSASAKTYRLFTTVNYKKEASPKSLTLQLKIMPLWLMIIRLIYFLPILILAEISVILIYFYRSRLHPFHLSKTRALTVRENLAIMKKQ